MPGNFPGFFVSLSRNHLFFYKHFCRPVVKHGGFLLSLPLSVMFFNRFCTVALGNAAVFPFLPGMAVFKPISGPFRFGWYKLSFLTKNAVKSKIRGN